MFCNYENINDYCANKYSYQYYDVIQSSAAAFASTGNNDSSVIRTDNDTGQQIILTPDSNDILQPCDYNDDAIEATTNWECYQIFLSSPNSFVSPANIAVIQNKQSENTNDNFYSSINDGVSTTGDGYNPINLKSSIEDQIHYGNIAMLANILYAEDNNNTMPVILDNSNIAYNLDYDLLNVTLTKYFDNFANKKYIKDDSLNKIATQTSVDDINQNYFCPGKIPNSYNTQTVISEPVIKEPPILPPDATCEEDSDCADKQCCDNGACGPCPCSNPIVCDGICDFIWTPGGNGSPGYWTGSSSSCDTSIQYDDNLQPLPSRCCCPEPTVENPVGSFTYYTQCICDETAIESCYYVN